MDRNVPTSKSLLCTAIILGLVAILLLPGTNLGPVARGIGPSAPVLTPSAVRSSTPGAAATSIGSIERTLVLYNQSVFPGNRTALWSQYDQYIAYDSANDTGWAVGQSFVGLSTLDVFDPTDDLGIRMMPAGGGAEIAYDNRTNTMWVTGDLTSNNVTVYNASSYAVVRTVGTGLDPAALTYDWRTRSMYIVNFDNQNITIVNDSTYAVSPSSPALGEYPEGIAFDPGSGNLFVAHGFGQNVTSFYQSGTVAPTSISIPGAGGLGTIADDPQNGMVYVSGVIDGVGIVDAATNTSAGTISLPNNTTFEWDGLAIDPVDHRLYVAQTNPGSDGNLVDYEPAPTGTTSTASGNTSLGLNSLPYAIAYDSADASILVVDTNTYGNEMSNVTTIRTDTGAQSASVGVQRLPEGAAYDPATHAVYVYDGGTGRVYKINDSTDEVVASAFVGLTPLNWVGLGGQVALDPANGSIFVDWYDVNAGSQGVAEFSATSLAFLRNFTSNFNFPTGMAYDTADHKLFVANENGNNLTVLSTVSWTISWAGAGTAPVGVAYAPNVDGIYVTNQGSDNVSVVNGATQRTTQEVDVALLPYGEVYDPGNGYVYVADDRSDVIQAIDTLTNETVGPQIQFEGTLGGPTWLAYDPAATTVIAADAGHTAYEAGNAGISLVNVTNDSYYGQIEFGDQDYGLAYDSGTGTLFAVATYPGLVDEIRIGNSSGSAPPLSVSLAAAPNPVPERSATDLTTTVTGGQGPFTYAYSTLPDGCTTADVAVLSCTPTETGSFTVGVNVTDSLGDTANAVTRLTVSVSTGALEVTLRAEPSTVTLSGATTLNTTVSGGTGYGTYTYAYSTLPTGCASANRSDLPCTAQSTGTFTIGVNVTDPIGDHGAATATLTVGSAAPVVLTATLTASPSRLELGGSTVLAVQVGGASVAPLTYLFTQLPTGCQTADTPSLTCVPSAAGSYTVQVEVHDAAGHYVNASASVTVTPAPSSTTSSSSSPLSGWLLAVIIAAVVIIALLIVLAVSRRRRKEPPVGSAPSP